MLRLPATPPEPFWETYREAAGDDPAVRVQFAPIGPASVAAARRAVAAALHVHPDDVETAGEAMSRELLQRGVIGWEGVGDSDGNPIEPTRDRRVKGEDGEADSIEPGTISLFLADQDRFDWADRVYVIPWVSRDAEKNGSSGSPAGTGQRATPVTDTATLAAPEQTTDALAAPTPSKPSKPKKPKQPGK